MLKWYSRGSCPRNVAGQRRLVSIRYLYKYGGLLLTSGQIVTLDLIQTKSLALNLQGWDSTGSDWFRWLVPWRYAVLFSCVSLACKQAHEQSTCVEGRANARKVHMHIFGAGANHMPPTSVNLPLDHSSKLLFTEAGKHKWGRKEFGALVKRKTNISDALFLHGAIRERYKMFSFLSIPDIPLCWKENSY